VIWPSVDFLRSLNKKRKREQKQRLKQLIDNLVKSIIDQQIYLEKKKENRNRIIKKAHTTISIDTSIVSKA